MTDFWKDYEPEPTRAAPVQPVGVTTGCASHEGFFTVVFRSQKPIPDGTNLYTTPPAANRQWTGLTDEDKLHIEIMGGKSDVMLAEMVDAKLKERNV